MLADLGAEVIRVESPSQKGKPSLVVGQVALSRGKLSMTLDVRQPQANDILQRMTPTVDVIVENASSCFSGRKIDVGCHTPKNMSVLKILAELYSAD